MGAAVGDYDNDGDLDLFLTAFGPDALFRNNGDGTFTDVTAEAGVSDPCGVPARRSSTTTVTAIWICSSPTTWTSRWPTTRFARIRWGRATTAVRGRTAPFPIACTATKVTAASRTSPSSARIVTADGAGLGVTSGDYNGDGWLDLYVANDATNNQLWINRRDGTFVDEGLLSGSAVNAAGNPEGSMGIASGDVDADGDEDLFVTNIIGETFVLYLNDGKGSFEDVRAAWGLAQPTAAFTGFGTNWIDYDNDGWLDLFVTNGAVNVVAAQRGQPNPFRMKNQLFRNTGRGRFLETSASGGPAFEMAEIGRGAAFGDVDNDGDTDIVVTNNGGPVRLLLNQAAAGQHWLQVRLDQPGGNRFGVGAWIGVERAGRPTLFRRVRTDGSYLSASDMRAHFGLGGVPRGRRRGGPVAGRPPGAMARRRRSIGWSPCAGATANEIVPRRGSSAVAT